MISASKQWKTFFSILIFLCIYGISNNNMSQMLMWKLWSRHIVLYSRYMLGKRGTDTWVRITPSCHWKCKDGYGVHLCQYFWSEICQYLSIYRNWSALWRHRNNFTQPMNAFCLFVSFSLFENFSLTPCGHQMWVALQSIPTIYLFPTGNVSFLGVNWTFLWILAFWYPSINNGPHTVQYLCERWR